VKAPALASVPQSREAAVRAVARVGELRARVAARKALADEAIRVAGEALERDLAQPLAELAEVERGVQIWCEAHRHELTAGGRTKTAELGTGRILWRARPPKVTARPVEAVIEACRRLGLERFLRVKVEVNKEAMLADADVARGIAGVSIGAEGEDFVIEPAEIGGPS
jgi:phage host-nuclease inhibitor protein Gam